jgi:hypothetical protein
VEDTFPKKKKKKIVKFTVEKQKQKKNPPIFGPIMTQYKSWKEKSVLVIIGNKQKFISSCI